MSTPVPIRFGLIGAGRVARDFATGLSAVPDAAVSAVWSRSADRANQFVSRFPGTRRAVDTIDLVDASDVDVVYVATPHQRHADDSLLALRHGKPVLCEKPFALSAAEARAVVKEARDRELFCMEAMWMRCLPAIHRAKELVDQGAIGEPRMLFADFGAATPYDPDSRFFDPEQGGGALLDRGVYAVSLAHLLLGTPDSVVGLSSPAPTGVDAQMGAVLHFPHQRIAVIAAALGTTTPSAAVITGTSGQLHLAAPFYCPSRLSIAQTRFPAAEDSDAVSLQERTAGALKRTRIGGEVVRAAKAVLRRRTVERFPMGGNGYGYEAAEVVRCLRSGLTESPMMPLDDSIAVMETLDILRSSSVRAQPRTPTDGTQGLG